MEERKNLFERMRQAAIEFLDYDKKNTKRIAAYFDGSNDERDVEAYYEVKRLNAIFVNLYNIFFDDRLDDCLAYDAADSVLY